MNTQTRAARDQHLARQGSVVNSRYPLRSPHTDEIAPQRCRGCKEYLRTEGEEATHILRHVAEGTLVASAGIGMTPDFFTAAEWKSSQEMKRRFGKSRPSVRLPAEALDGYTNAIRAKCSVCGNSTHLTYKEGWKHVDEPTNEDHQAEVLTVPDEEA